MKKNNNDYSKAKGRTERNWNARGTVNPMSAKNQAINKAKKKASTSKKTGGSRPGKKIGVNIY